MDIDKYLNEKVVKSKGKSADAWREIQELYEKKQWHPLTLRLKEFVKETSLISKENVIEMHDKFIREFEHRTNPVALTEIIVAMAHTLQDRDVAVKFIESIKNVIKNDNEASILLEVGVADVQLMVKDNNGRCSLMKQIKLHLDEAQNKLQSIDGVVTYVHGPYYRASSTYLREVGDYGGYYRESLRYLGCVDLKQLSNEDKAFHAYCLALAAILGDNVYNFGELLAHPVLDSLKGKPDEYMADLLHVFNAGDLRKFNEMRPQWSRQNDLKLNEVAMRRKIQLLALMELAFNKNARRQKITFEEIHKTADVDLDKVEFLAMKALARGLVQGRLDEVQRTFDVTWVQPRVLSKQQVSDIAKRIGHWHVEVKHIAKRVHDNAREILTQS